MPVGLRMGWCVCACRGGGSCWCLGGWGGAYRPMGFLFMYVCDFVELVAFMLPSSPSSLNWVQWLRPPPPSPSPSLQPPLWLFSPQSPLWLFPTTPSMALA